MTTCSHCDVELVAFAVPESLRKHAPDETEAAAICPRCLRVTPTDAGSPAPEFDRIDERFPRGEGGVTFALLLGTLPNLTLEKASVVTLRDRAEVAGVDVALALDRLVRADIDPHFALERRVSQMDSLLE